MNYKVSGAVRRSKKYYIIYGVIWFLLAFLLIPAAVYGYAIATRWNDGTRAISEFANAVKNPIAGFSGVFSLGLFGEYMSTMLISTVIYTIFFVIGFIKAAPKNEYTDIEHGSSGWSAKGEQYQILNKNKGIILAEKNYLPVDKRGNVNVLVVGGSGSGKSASYSIPNAYQMLGSYIFTDPKGELYDRTAGYLKEHGYQIKVLNLVNPSCSDGYNPLMHITSNLDVDVIANTIVKGQKSESGSSSDPYWDDMAEQLLKALIYYLIATRPEEEQNLASCAELVRAANTNGGSNLLTDLMSKLPLDHPARMNYKNIEIAPDRTYSSILSSLQSKLGKFDSKEIAELTSTDTIDFEEIGSQKTAVYVVSSDTHTAYDFLLTIFFSQMIQHLYDYADKNGGKLKEQTFFILDEFANIGQIPDFDKKISTSRSRNISFSVILQNLDQLEAVYEKSYETIVGNCDTHVFLGSNSFKTLEYFSKALGEKTIERDNISVNKDRQNWVTGKSTSDNVLARALMTPDELRRMDVDQCIIFVKGLRPVKAEKYYYFKKPMCREMAALEISHNDIEQVDRGVWRKFNPYHPYEEESENKQEDLKVESLDDLFDDNEEGAKAQPQENSAPAPQNTNSELAGVKPPPIIPDNDDEVIDIQKELEAKFDELFGPIDDDNE